MHPYHHAVSSAKRHGGEPEAYLEIHNWFDASKEFFADFRHRAVRHHAQGIFECERVFGVGLSVFVANKIKVVPVRTIGEQHVMEDLGWIPSIQDWLKCIKAEPWMLKVAVKSHQLEGDLPTETCSKLDNR